MMHRFQKKAGWSISLLMITMFAFSQVNVDSLSTPYDSIQDLQLNRLNRELGRRLDQTEARLRESIMTSDSLAMELGLMEKRLEQLQKEHLNMDDQIRAQGKQLEDTSAESRDYRQKLQSSLWVAGTILLILLISSFVILLIYSLKTRWLLENLKRRLIKLQKAVRILRSKVRHSPGMEKRTIRKIAGKEVKNRLKGLKSENK